MKVSSSDTKRRYISLFTVVVLSALISSCGDSPDTVNLVSPASPSSFNGSEPRIQLALTAPASVRLLFSSRGQQELTVDGQTSTQLINTIIQRDAILSSNGNAFQIESIPELISYSPQSLRPEGIEVAREIKRYNLHGETLLSRPNDSLQGALTLETLSLPALTLSHPDTPVGVGAEWTEFNSSNLLNSTVVTKVLTLSADSISVSKTIDAGIDSEEHFTVAGEMTATYTLPSLLLTHAEVRMTVRFEGELYVNGARETVVDNTVYTQSITEVVE